VITLALAVNGNHQPMLSQQHYQGMINPVCYPKPLELLPFFAP
jgi:hypothetical protein